MKEHIGRIYSLLVYYSGGKKQSGLFLLSVEDILLSTPVNDVDKRFIFHINGSPAYVTDDCLLASKNAILACQNLFKNNPSKLNDFKKRQFTVNIETHDPSEEINIEGRSHEFAIAICVLSSFLEIPIKGNVAVTGSINKDTGQIQYVQSIIEKLRPFVEQKDKKLIKRFILPNLLTLDQLIGNDRVDQGEVQKTYQYIAALDKRKLSSRKQSVILCNTLMESIIYLTTVNGFKQAFLSFIKLSKTQELREFIYGNGFETDLKNRIFGSPNVIKKDIEQKRNKLESHFNPSQESRVAQELIIKRKQFRERLFFFIIGMLFFIVAGVFYYKDIHQPLQISFTLFGIMSFMIPIFDD